MPVDVVFPVLNEIEALPWVLGRMPIDYRAIVVDNGSDDGSGELATELGAVVVSEPQRGFGAACAAGLVAARAEVVMFCDADASLDPAQLPLVAGPVLDGSADLVLGARQPEPGSWPFHARLANRYLAARVNRATGVFLSDLGPMRAARRIELIELAVTDRRFGWPLEQVMAAGLAGWRVSEVPVTYRKRRGKSKVTGTLKGTVRAINDMRAILARYAPEGRRL